MRFGTTVATVLLWANTNVLVAVPNLAPGTYPVTVTVGGRVSNATNFLVTAQRTQLGHAQHRQPRRERHARRHRLRRDAGHEHGALRQHERGRDLVEQHADRRDGAEPAGRHRVGLTVTVDGVASNAVNFLVTSPVPPAITTLSPTSGAAGSVVTITGSNFGGFQGSSTVRFGTTNATIVSWSNTQLSVTVPAIAAGVVQVNGHRERQHEQLGQLHRDDGDAAELHVRVPGRASR